MRSTRRALAAPAVVLALLLSACSGDEDDGPFITVYNAQHEELLEEIAPLFTEQTGIDVKLRNGDDFELANTLVQEGDASPADVFLTENSPAMSLVDGNDLFAPLAEETLGLVPARYAPDTGNWMGFVARSTVLVHHNSVAEGELPAPNLGPAEPAAAGRAG